LGGNDGYARGEVLDFAPTAPRQEAHIGSTAADWRNRLRADVLASVADFVATRCATDLGQAGIDVAVDVLAEFVGGGKCLRSTFAYLGWLCGAADDETALQAAASFELLHAFALLQDDVMDGSTMRRGRPAAHIAFAQWHQQRGLPGSPARFGESAAVLLGDLCLVWAEQMLRESGLGQDALARVWPHYDAMRTELAVGQFADLTNHSSAFPTLAHVLDVARRKSGNYTVRRPLEIGAVLSGCGSAVVTLLGHYGEAVGEAFQLRDDVLGVFGVSTVTGKPAGGDLTEQKATSVVVAAHHLADATTRRQLCELMSADALDENDVRRWRSLIASSGALEWVEQQIDSRIDRALDWIDTRQIDVAVRAALADMAAACAERAA
jgi:geranylgeranyl diphosphate synthase type I